MAVRDTPLPEILRTTWPGGFTSLAGQASPPPSSNPNPSSSVAPTQTPALVLAWQSRLDPGGARGDLHRAGSLKGETSNGPKRSALNSSSPAYATSQAKESTSLSTGTTRGSLRAGGRDVAPTDQPTSFSVTSFNFWRAVAEQYTCDTSQVPKTPLTPLPVVSTPPAPSSSTLSSSLSRPDLSSLMFDVGELAKKAVVNRLMHMQNPGIDATESEPQAVKQRRTPDARMRHLQPWTCHG